MPDLEELMQEWRRQMKIGSVEALDELECHLRDDIDEQIAAGTPERDAFNTAVANLGGADLLNLEFCKIAGCHAGDKRLKHVLLTFAGIPHSHLETDMNTLTSNQTSEPRWATYMKAAAFVSPSIILWTFSVMWLFPKLQQICKVAAVPMPSVYRTTAFIADNTLFVCAAILLLLVSLEWRWPHWPKYRRATLGSAVFALNTGVLVLITLMVVLALLAAPALMQHGG